MIHISTQQRVVSWDAFDGSIYSEDSKESFAAYTNCFSGTSIVSSNIHIITSTSEEPDKSFGIANIQERNHIQNSLDLMMQNETKNEENNPLFFQAQPDSDNEEGMPHSNDIMISKGKKRERTTSFPRFNDNVSFSEDDSESATLGEEEIGIVSGNSDPPAAVTDNEYFYSILHLPDVIQLTILGYLHLKDVQGMGLTCKHMNALLKNRCADWIWKDLMNVVWPRLNVSHNDIIWNGETTDNINYSKLFAQSSENYPTNINPLFAERIVARKVWNHRLNRFRSILREPEFRTYSMGATIKHYAKCPQHYQDITVWQFKGATGEGNRCIRSNKPFPRPKFQTSTQPQQQSLEKFDPNSSLLSFSSGYPNMSFLDILKQRAKKTKSSSDNGIRLPFVSPFWYKDDTDLTRITSNHHDQSECYRLHLAPRLIAYFEVSILSRDTSREDNLPNMGFPRLIGHHDNANRNFNHGIRQQRRNGSASDCIAVGISNEEFNTDIKDMPGWDKYSYAYHSDDGGIFHGRGEMQQRYGPKYGIGDTVGCGINYENNGIFFTLNGKFLGYAWTGLPMISNGEHQWYPTVGVDTDSPLAFNFGVDRPFLFDFAKFVACAGKAMSTKQ